MYKYVYLFELDSVRKTDREILAGQKALYDEIAGNGNTVVLTYNQLVDSRAFFSLLRDDTYYENFIQLFQKGYIRVSQFGGIRTIVQYLLDTIDNEENQFIYSALPIKGSQTRLIGLIKRSLTYSDLSEIHEYTHRINRTDDDLRDLFTEVEIVDGKTEERQSALSCDKMDWVLRNLYRLLETVLKLSTIRDIFLSPREPDEYSGFTLKNYLAYVCRISISSERDPLWDKAVHILKNSACWGSDNRSLYFHELKLLCAKDPTADKTAYQYAEAIVNLCVNYAYEMSICNISKHYNIADMKCAPSESSSFFNDFLTRLKQHWDNGADAENRFLQNESNVFSEFNDLTLIPDFSKIVRVIPEKEEELYEEIPRYEYKLRAQRRSHKLKILKPCLAKLLPYWLSRSLPCC